MKELFRYKGFLGSVEVSIEDDCLHGRVLFIDDMVTYEADTPTRLREEFQASVEDYLATCKELGSKVTCHDIAAYILRETGEITTMKLQKLVYYAQAWSLVWDEKPLFNERIEAWLIGPVIPDLYSIHSDEFTVEKWPLGNPDILDETQRETVQAVLDFYGEKNSQWLSDLTRREDPWVSAWELTLREGENIEITLAAMNGYYSNL